MRLSNRNSRSLLLIRALSASLVLVSALSDDPEATTRRQNVLASSTDKLQSASTTPSVRYIVKFNNAAAGKAQLAGQGIGIALDLSAKHSAVAAVMRPQQAAGLANNPNVVLVEEDPVRVPLAYSDNFPAGWPDDDEGIPYGIKMVQADFTSPVYQDAPADGVSVCIIDSGYLEAHEDLRGNDPDPAGLKVNGYSGVDGTAEEDWNKDGDGHGTHVAGTIAGSENGLGVVGVLPKGVHLSIVRVFGDDGVWGYYPYNIGDELYGSELAHAMDKCQELQQPNTKLVVNMSLGGGAPSAIEEAAFQTAYDAGDTIVIAAAGNDESTALSYPASYPSVVSASAVDANENHAGYPNRNAQVEVSAPGVSVMSTISHSGTGSVEVATQVGSNLFVADPIAGTPDSSDSGVSGDLVDGQNCANSPKGNAWRNKVVLCARDGETFFQTMVDSASSARAAAVVIRNHNLSGGGPLKVTATGTIPGAGVNYDDGLSLLASATLNEQATVVAKIISPDTAAYTAYGGTSMAAPHVSGVAALLWHHNPQVSSQQLRAALRDAAVHPGGDPTAIDPMIDHNFGHGIIKASDAHDYLAGPCADLPCDDSDPCTWNRCVDQGASYECLPTVPACVVEGPPEIESMDPSESEQGTTVTVEILGHDFHLPATIGISGSGVTLSESIWYDPTRLSTVFTISSTAELGERTVTFTHTDEAGNALETATAPFTVLEGTCGGSGAPCNNNDDCCDRCSGGRHGTRTCI